MAWNIKSMRYFMKVRSRLKRNHCKILGSSLMFQWYVVEMHNNWLQFKNWSFCKSNGFVSSIQFKLTFLLCFFFISFFVNVSWRYLLCFRFALWNLCNIFSIRLHASAKSSSAHSFMVFVWAILNRKGEKLVQPKKQQHQPATTADPLLYSVNRLRLLCWDLIDMHRAFQLFVLVFTNYLWPWTLKWLQKEMQHIETTNAGDLPKHTFSSWKFNSLSPKFFFCKTNLLCLQTNSIFDQNKNIFQQLPSFYSNNFFV